MINWLVRFKNPVFIAQLILAIIMPIVAYAGITAADITTWATLGNLILMALSNPFVLFTVAVSVWNCINDPTTAGLGDSKRVMKYTAPKVSEEGDLDD